MSKKTYTIGVDIGGTKMLAVLFDGENVIEEYTLATPKDNVEHFFIMLNALINPLEEKARKNKIKIKGIGLGIAGTINYKEGKILNSPNIPIINNVEIIAKLKEIMPFSIFLDNDANCFLRAEKYLGAAQKYNNIYGIVIGTGIGGAWWFNNQIYQGTYGGAGEPGSMVINFENGLELEESYHRLMKNNPALIAQEAYKGNDLAKKTFNEFGKDLGFALANIINIIDPEAIVVGGGVSEVSDLFLTETKKAMLNHIASSESKQIKLLKSKLGKKAGAIGAALLIK